MELLTLEIEGLQKLYVVCVSEAKILLSKFQPKGDHMVEFQSVALMTSQHCPYPSYLGVHVPLLMAHPLLLEIYIIP